MSHASYPSHFYTKVTKMFCDNKINERNFYVILSFVIFVRVRILIGVLVFIVFLFTIHFAPAL